MSRLALGAISVAWITFMLGCGLPTSGIPGSGGSGGSGGMHSCKEKVDCPVDTACVSHACTSGKCVATARPNGSHVSDGSPSNDCKQTVCMNGATTQVADDTEVADDMNPCTTDACKNGKPTHVPVTDSTPCGGGLSCSNGVCSGCTMASQCPQGNTCRAATCDAGACGFDTAAQEGHVCMPAQGPCFDESVCQAGNCIAKPRPAGNYSDGSDGNCKSTSCDGSGNGSTVSDNNDLPTGVPPDCQVNGCLNGMPALFPGQAGMQCGGIGKCNSVQMCCTSGPPCVDACCGPGEACMATGGCCQAASACGATCCPAGATCVNGQCCSVANACGALCCPAGASCVNGQCCAAANVCGFSCCNPLQDKCVTHGGATFCCAKALACGTTDCCKPTDTCSNGSCN